MPPTLEAAVSLPVKLSQLFGLFPYDGRTLGRSFWGLISVMAVLVVSVNLYIISNSSKSLNLDSFATSLFRILSVVPWISSCVLLLRSFTIRPEISRVVKRIQLVERRFKLNSRQCTSKFPFLLDFTIRTVMILCEIAASYVVVRGKIEQFLIRLVGFYLTHFIQNVYELQFLAFVHLLTSWFHSLSKHLTLKNTTTFLECYNDLSVACDQLNRAFKVQNFVTVSNNFLLCVVECYVCQVTSSETVSPLTVNTFMTVVVRIYQTMVFMISAARLTNQARHFDEVLYTLTITDHTKWLVRDVRIKEHLNQRLTIVFVGWNMFPLDMTQLHSIAALIFNYLIILVQFGGSDHSAQIKLEHGATAMLLSSASASLAAESVTTPGF